MTCIQEVLDTINLLRMRASESGLTASERQACEEAWAVLEQAGVTVRYQAWLGDLLMGEGETENEAIDAAVAEYEKAIGYGDEPHLYPTRDELVADLYVFIDLPGEGA